MSKFKKFGKKVGKKLYSGAAAFGRFNSTVALVFVSFFGLVLLIIGISFLRKQADEVITATVTDFSKYSSMCRNSLSTNNLTNGASYCVQIKANGVTQWIQTNKEFVVGDTVTLYKSDDSYSLSKSNPQFIGIFLILFGLFIVIIGYMSYRFTHRNKTYAAIQGANAAVQLFR